MGLLGMVLGYVATWSIQFVLSEDELDAGGQTLLDALDTGEIEALFRLTSGVGYLSVFLLVWFAFGLQRMLARREKPGLVPVVILGSFLITGAALVVSFAIRAQVFDGLSSYQADPSAHVTIYRLSQDTVLASWGALGLATAAATVGAFQKHIFPVWLGVVSAVATVLIILLLLGGLAFPSNIPAGVWLFVTSIWAITEARKATP
jgi:hypothetical protein